MMPVTVARTTGLLTAWAVACLGSATAQEKGAAAPGALVGSWKADVTDAQALILRIGKDKVELSLDEGGTVKPLWAGKISFPREHADRHFDWVGLSGGGRPLPDNKCLYRLSGNTLLIIGGGAGDRPTRFLSGPGAEPRTLVFSRVHQ